MKLTTEILNELSLGQYNDKFEHVLCDVMYEEDKYTDVDSFFQIYPKSNDYLRRAGKR